MSGKQRLWILLKDVFHYCVLVLTKEVFQSCAALRPYIEHIDDIYKDFTSYKIRVPVTGAIILDETFERVRDVVL